MKTLKFTAELVEKILAAKKTSTWRPFDDKDLQVGDEVNFLDQKTLKKFGVGKLTRVELKTFGTLEDKDWEGHERYSSRAEMYKTYQGYFPNEVVTENTEVKIVHFTFSPQ
jgi:hypothetical protein